MKALVWYGSDATLSGVSPVYIAAQNGDLEALKYLLQEAPEEHGSRAKQASAPEDRHGREMLSQKIRQLLDKPVVKVLWREIGEDVGPNRAKRGGTTPLYIACQNGHFSMVQMLIELRAEVNKSLQTLETPLFIACQGGFLEEVRVLVEAKAKVNEAKQGGASPLYVACQKGHVEVVRYLL
ncbi:ANKRD29, partial [Symbiodinium pilosum]